jgi:hypothetical protein
MGYNVLSGSVSSVGVIQSGSFSGDGSGLENVKQFELFNASAAHLPFYRMYNGELALDGNSGLLFENSALTVPALTSSVGIRLTNPVSGTLAGIGSYVGLDANGNMVVTSSAAGTGTTNSLQFHIGGGEISGSSNLSFASNTLTLSGTMSMSGSFIPGDSGVHSLGSATNRWDQIFVGTGSVHLGPNCSISTNETFGTIDFNKPLSIGGGISAQRQQVTSSVTASSLSYFIGVSASSAITVQMPSAATLLSGQIFVIKDEAGNAEIHNITVKSSGSQTIDGRTTVILESPYAAVNLYSNGSDKFFIY